MKKIIFTFFVFFAFFISLNASTDYSDYELITVDELPTASSSTLNRIYQVDDEYFITSSEETGTAGGEIVLGDNLRNTTINIDSDVVYFYDMDGIGDTYLLYFNNSTTYFLRGNWYMTQTFVNLSLNYQWTRFYEGPRNSRVHTPLISTFTFPDIDLIVTSIDPIYTNHYSSHITTSGSLTTVYSWEEISYYDFYTLPDTANQDLFLFYSFSDISSFDIFTDYDFTSFTDYEKLLFTIVVNIFYLCFIGFIIYIFLKSLNKIVSWLFR